MLVWWIPVGGVLGFWHYKTLLKPDSKHFVMEIPKNHIAFRWLEKNKREHHPCKPPTNHWLWSMQKTRNKKNTNLNQQPTIDWPNQDFRLSIVVGISFEMLKCSFRLYLFLTQNSKKKRNVFFPPPKDIKKNLSQRICFTFPPRVVVDRSLSALPVDPTIAHVDDTWPLVRYQESHLNPYITG